MSMLTLRPQPITVDAFAPFGDVVHAAEASANSMNEARFERFDDLAQVDVDQNGGGHVAISIARSNAPTQLPYQFDMIERHPLGSQAFIPLQSFAFIVVVAADKESAEAGNLHAFVTDGSQGINYHRGVWHMPLISLERDQFFLIVDRAPGDNNCDVLTLREPVMLEAP